MDFLKALQVILRVCLHSCRCCSGQGRIRRARESGLAVHFRVAQGPLPHLQGGGGQRGLLREEVTCDVAV